jgi:hypothetical protein
MRLSHQSREHQKVAQFEDKLCFDVRSGDALVGSPWADNSLRSAA